MEIGSEKLHSDIEIALSAKMKPIKEIANSIGIKEDELDQYGKYKAKINSTVMKRLEHEQDGNLILVTSINPTKAGEGKSTVTVGLGDALQKLGHRTIIALREPSLGPVMGLKGGAAGGGYSQVLPMDEINLHFTGDIHAITTANNALAAFIDNHIHQGNELGIDPRRIVWKRSIDMNDRVLRNITVGLGGPSNGVPREDGFDITVASEIMAVLCLADGLQDIKKRLSKMVIGYTWGQRPVTVADLGVEGALTLILKEAMKPNLVQTIAHTPAFVHGGPFANIAHGCNSVAATKTALKLADYVVTEAGFGADLGAEKFLHIKARGAGISPKAVVIVATVRALKMHGGALKEELTREDLSALKTGFENVKKHAETISAFGLPFIIALNRFADDSPLELEAFGKLCLDSGISYALTEVWEKGGGGGIELAEGILKLIEDNNRSFEPLYDLSDSLEVKIVKVAKTVYGASDVDFTPAARQQMKKFEQEGWGSLPVCIAKTQYSLSDNPVLLGRPTGFKLTVRELKPKIGAGFIVALTGDIMTMPGLPKSPAALRMDVDESENAVGLF
ncbi:formate--tetrahydrofolate ligase [Peribacillus saganii]|uniref:Formate--tetrahydrofolate ligase n=1 Tax=Peribacillus saganii TaxID=2303992 RepID=A0A372LR85_9BACI|nr:formate--tetrahydrofolate ligase [Peribacillus saganii]RFU69692.1 formate--tetrahydrofolate ligase [Peribacillus saganii]